VDDAPFILPTLPDAWRSAALAQLENGEVIHGWFETDLDESLHFVDGLVLLTDRRVMSAQTLTGGAGKETIDGAIWRSVRLTDAANLRAKERNGLGILELLNSNGRLAVWRYTASRAAAAHELAERFDSVRRGLPLDAVHQDDAQAEGGIPTPPPPVSTWTLFRLARFAKPRAGLILVGFLLTLATTAAGLVPPYLTIPLMNKVLVPYQSEVTAVEARTEPNSEAREIALRELQQTQGPKFRLVAWCLTGLAAAAIAAWLFGWAQGAVMAWVSERIAADLRNTTYGHLHKLSLEFFSGRRTGDLIARISSDTDRICNFLSDNLVDFGTDVLMIIGTACILVYLDPVLAVATLLPFPLIAWLVYYVRAQLQHGFQRGGRAWSEMTNVLADTIPGIRVVKAFAQERREVERFRAANDRILDANDRVNTVWAFFWPLVLLLNTIGLLVVWAFGAWRVYDFAINTGVMLAFLGYIARFYTRLESMSRMLSMTQRAAASAQRLFEILDRVPSVPEPVDPVIPGTLHGEIELRGVCFRYGSRPVIDNLDLKIKPGEMIGLVGTSGAGKSTLINLVCRFYDVAQGAVLVDGVDIRRFPVSEYRRHIGMVLQDPFLFYGTIADNIAYGRPDATRAEIVAAARAAKAHDFIMRMPDGYDSLVGERGQTLSGGERQRVSIARAILIDPQILILDEATSSVDTETEREIQQALDNLIQGRTTIAIAHRLSTLRKADRLIVMDRGRIVETGKHQQLVGTPGVYARLHKAQLAIAQEMTE
jgi:ATP-binding cassette subfamily B protein